MGECQRVSNPNGHHRPFKQSCKELHMRVIREVSNPNGHHRPFKHLVHFHIGHRLRCFKSQRTSQAFQTRVHLVEQDVVPVVSNPNGHHRPFKPYREFLPNVSSSVSNPNGHHRPFKRLCPPGYWTFCDGFKSQRTSQAFQTSLSLDLRRGAMGFKSQRTSQAFQTGSHRWWAPLSRLFQIPTDITGLSNS